MLVVHDGEAQAERHLERETEGQPSARKRDASNAIGAAMGSR